MMLATVITVIMFLITAAMARHHQSKDRNDNFFAAVNVAIHSVVNDLFESINLDPNFANNTKTTLLLTMHSDLSKIADKSFDIFKDIQKLVRDNINNQTDVNYLPTKNKEDAIKLDTIVKEILNKHNFDVYRAVKRISRYAHKRTKVKVKVKDNDEDNTELTDEIKKVKIKPDFDDSTEFTEFVINFLTKVNNLTIKDFKKSTKRGSFLVPSKKNLKVWDEPIKPSLRYDLDVSYDTRRIFKGSKTRFNSYPFIVSIHIMGEFSCSGCIISRDFIITAASCLNIAYKSDFFEKNLKSIYVRLGSSHTAKDGETIPVQNVYFHPGYDPEHLVNNLAIVGLEKRVRFSRQQKRIRRIAWDKTPDNLSNDTKSVLILGWGATKAGQVTQKFPKLRVSKLDVYNISDCKKKYSEDFIRKENFCAAYNGVNGSACSGDSGGPAIVGAVLVGVVSFGAQECGAAGSPTVFTKLGFYVPWIESIVNAHHKTNKTNFDTRRKFQKHKNANTFHGRLDDYPDDVKALRDTLLELVHSDKPFVNDALYGDSYDEFNKYFNDPDQIEYEEPTSDDNENENLLKFEFEFDARPDTNLKDDTLDSTTCKTAVLRKGLTDTEGDDTHAGYNDYTDNYEESSTEEHGLSIEVPEPLQKKKVLRIKNNASSENKSDRRSSDESKDYSYEITDFYIRNKKHSKKRESKKHRGNSMYLSGAPFNGDDMVDASSMDKKEISREVLMTREHLSKHARFILNEGKSLATKKLFIEQDPKNVQVNHDKHKHKNSTANNMQVSRDKHKHKNITAKNAKVSHDKHKHKNSTAKNAQVSHDKHKHKTNTAKNVQVNHNKHNQKNSTAKRPKRKQRKHSKKRKNKSVSI